MLPVFGGYESNNSYQGNLEDLKILKAADPSFCKVLACLMSDRYIYVCYHYILVSHLKSKSNQTSVFTSHI